MARRLATGRWAIHDGPITVPASFSMTVLRQQVLCLAQLSTIITHAVQRDVLAVASVG